MKRLIVPILVASIAIGALWFLSLQQHNQHLSVKPALSYSTLKLKPLPGNIGVQAKLPFRALINAAEHATADPQTGSGEKQSCKRVLGAKICATLQWQYSIQRIGDVRIESRGDKLRLSIPVGFNGLVSVDGRGGKLLGLRNKKIDGALELHADLTIGIAKNWCPTVKNNVSYRWISDPGITLAGSIRINLRKPVNKALNKKVKDLQSRLANLIDCDELRQKIQQQWRTHVFDIDLQDDARSQLIITPVSASVSDINMLPDHASLSLELGATLQMKQLDSATGNKQPATDAFSQLPDLTAHTATPGTVEFSLLIEVPYDQLRDKLAKKVIGKTYQSNGAGTVTVTSVELYPADELLIIDIGFKANTFGSLIKTSGNLYISTRPVAYPDSDQLILEDLQLTRLIDSKLLTAVTTILRQQLLSALQEVSVIDLEPAITKIESSIEKALTDPDKTSGIKIDVRAPEVKITAINPQADGLAAMVKLSTRLRATVPDDLLIR